MRAGDLVTVRGGTYTEPMVLRELPAMFAGLCVLELVKKGTAANPIVYKALRRRDARHRPRRDRSRSRAHTPGLVYGVCAGVSAPVGLCKARLARRPGLHQRRHQRDDRVPRRVLPQLL